MTVLVLVELDGDALSIVSREALTFARQLRGDLHAIVVGSAAAAMTDCRDYGVRVVHEAITPQLETYAAAARAAAVAHAASTCGATTVLAGGSARGTEVLAHLAARAEVPMAANVVRVVVATPLVVERQVVGGAALEQLPLDASLRVFTVAGHCLEPAPADTPGEAELRTHTPAIDPKDLRARVARVETGARSDTAKLTSARVVVGAGRGVGRQDGFESVIALADRLGGALGVSRVVTSLGWRPHAEQVGQTGSRISPDVYLPCGISGAIQHWAGCQSSKTIIAINTDPDAPMVTKAHYAVIGDLHDVVPAILDELGPR